MPKNIRPAKAKQQRGVMLLEVLIGMLIFLVGALGLIGLQAKSVTQSIDASARSQAAFVVQEFFTQMDANLPTAARTSELTLAKASLDAIAPVVFDTWKTSVLQSSTLGLPNATATYLIIQDAGTLSIELSVTWQLKVGETGADATTAHSFVTRKPFI
jgi:type IV pilus assembly protein PilV